MPNIIPSAIRAMNVFETFARERRELTNAEVARLLDMTPSSSTDLLYSLQTAGYLMRTPITKRFYPTGLLQETAGRIAEADALAGVGREVTALLTDATQESSFFGCLDNGAARVISTIEGHHPLRYVLKVGDRISLHASAMGKAMLGLYSDDEARSLLRLKPLRRLTNRTIIDPEKLLDNIREGRERGWYLVDGEANDDVTAIGVAMFLGKEPVGFSIAGPTVRLDKQRDEFVERLVYIRDRHLAPSAKHA